MKTIQFFTLMLLLVVITSCNTNDDSTPLPTQPISWNLTRVTGGFAGVDETFPRGLITWSFNSETNMLTIVNNNDNEASNDMFDSGTYPYSIQTTETGDILSVNEIELGKITVTQNELTIEQQTADGFTLTFIQ